jgi:hypothetical protein
MQLAHSLGLDASQTASPLEGERESFSLDILSHRITYEQSQVKIPIKSLKIHPFVQFCQIYVYF